MFPKRIARVLLLGALVASALPVSAFADEAGAAWGPYLQNDKGEKSAMPSDPLHNSKEMKDKKWLQVQYTAYTGFKPRLAVVQADNQPQTSAEVKSEWVRLFRDLSNKPDSPAHEADPFRVIPEMLGEALGNTNRFRMVERLGGLDQGIQEQDFGQSGRVDKGTAPKVGDIKGADFLVKTTLVEVNPKKEARSIGVGAGALGNAGAVLGGFGVSGTVAFCSVNVRVFNSQTMEIVANATVYGTAETKTGGFGVGALGGLGGGLVGGLVQSSHMKADPMSFAIQCCMNKAAYYVASQIEDQPVTCKVASAKSTGILIIGGSNVGLHVGDTGTYFSRGEDVVDPDTHEVIEHSMNEVGKVRVTAVQERSATCEPTTTIANAKGGDFVRFDRGKK